MATIIPIGGVYPKRVIPTLQEILRDEKYEGKINIGSWPKDVWKAATDMFKKKKKGAGDIPAPPAPGFTSRFNYGNADTAKALADEVAYRMICDEIEKDGYRVVELPAAEMKRKYDNVWGFEEGNSIYIGAQHDAKKKVEIAYHELECKKRSKKSGRPHYEFHPQVEAEQGSAADSYVRKAMQALAMN